MPRKVSAAPRIRFVAAGQTIDPQLLARIRTCKLRFHLKAGMTNQEANDAIDAGYQAYFKCLKSIGRK